MGMKEAIGFVVVAWAVAACAAEQPEERAEREERAQPDPAVSGAALGDGQQLVGDCTVSLQCPSAPTISCSGTNSQCAVGTSSVTCNGVTTTCLPPSSACMWAGTTYIHGSVYLGQCSSRIDGVCRSGPFTGLECEAALHCSPKCQFGEWVPRF